MTQIGRYGQMLKVQIDKVRMKVRIRYRLEGSVLANSVKSQCLGAETEIYVESKEDPSRVARVIRNAENGCFVHQSLVRPVPVQGSVILNGSQIEVDQLFKP